MTEPAAEAVYDAFLGALRGRAAKLDSFAAALITFRDPDLLARAAQALEEHRRELADVLDTLKKAIPPLIPYQKGRPGVAEVEGVGAVRVRASTKRSGWQKDRMRAKAEAFIADERIHFADPETGELRPPAEVAHRVIGRFLDLFGLAAPKLEGWRAIGVDPDQYAEVEHDKATVQIPRQRDRSPSAVLEADQ